MNNDMQSSLYVLLQRAREGNRAEQDRLFQACRNYLDLVARAQLETWMQAKADASDLVQQTLLEAHRDFHRFEGHTEGEWLAWLRKILANNAGDFIRRFRQTSKRSIKREISLTPFNEDSQPLPWEPKDQGQSPSALVMQRELEIQLADAVAELPEDYREVILLRNLQRLPFDQVAQRMGRSRPAVQMLWMRAIRKLQECLNSDQDQTV